MDNIHCWRRRWHGNRRMKKYQPANGTEGECFMEAWCHHCEREGGSKVCGILTNTMVYDVTDVNYPKEWIYGADGIPACTAFIREGDAIQDRCEKTEDMFE